MNGRKKTLKIESLEERVVLDAGMTCYIDGASVSHSEYSEGLQETTGIVDSRFVNDSPDGGIVEDFVGMPMAGSEDYVSFSSIIVGRTEMGELIPDSQVIEVRGHELTIGEVKELLEEFGETFETQDILETADLAHYEWGTGSSLTGDMFEDFIAQKLGGEDAAGSDQEQGRSANFGEDNSSNSVTDTDGHQSASDEVTMRSDASARQNPVLSGAVNASGDITPDDALRVINKLAEDGRDADGIVLADGIPVADGDSGPGCWGPVGIQFVTPNGILSALNQLAENAVNDRGIESAQPSGELILSDTIEIGTNVSRIDNRFDPVLVLENSTGNVISESTSEAQLDVGLIATVVGDESHIEEDVATIDDVLPNLF